jgi:outer membrane receptor protein involved in Fe transport
VARRSWKRADISLGYAWMRKNDNYTTDVVGSFYAMNFASHRFTAAVVFRPGFGLEARCDNEFRIQEKNALRRGTDTPFFTSLGLVWRLPQFEGLSLSAQVDNLWNTRYEEVPLVPGASRTWSVRASYQW